MVRLDYNVTERTIICTLVRKNNKLMKMLTEFHYADSSIAEFKFELGVDYQTVGCAVDCLRNAIRRTKFRYFVVCRKNRIFIIKEV